MKALDRYLGCMLGLAAGDAVGTTVEFAARGSFPPVTDMTGGGPFRLESGQWTDDTSMALCLAASLTERGGFDARDQMTRYCRWWKEGYLSSTGGCFDIGNTTRGALDKFQALGNPFAGAVDEYSAGNGSLMRLAPVPLFFFRDPEGAITCAGRSSQTTHGAPAAVDACRYFAGVILGALRGETKETILSPLYCPLPGYWEMNPLHPEVRRIALGSFKGKPATEIRASGFVIHTLEAALWAFHSSSSFEEGCLKAVNLGEDADTTGAVFGQLAGAFYGRGGIPASWVSKLTQRETIERLAESLYRFGYRPHANCYWIEPDVLMAGEYPGHLDAAVAQERVGRIVNCGVTCFLDLTAENELKPYQHFLPELGLNGKPIEHHRHPIQDNSVPKSKADMRQILERIETAIASSHVVYVHCWGGAGRTGTVVACWLQKHQGLTAEQALNQITDHFWPFMSLEKQARHNGSPECACQKDFVREWR